mgnify:CR=1 FL=1
MKNKIEYYYRIENINLHEQNNIYNFLYNNKKYIQKIKKFLKKIKMSFFVKIFFLTK